jgi:predicted RNA-binding Zn-ribbon protein involved in translation (DUF1610 family)
VCGSIIFGVAVVPSQAAALVEALLDRERVKSGRASRIRTSSNGSSFSSNGQNIAHRSNDSSSNELLALDTSIICPNCGAKYHWADAQYCFSCGEELRM